VEVCEAVLPRNLVNAQFNFAERTFLILHQVSAGNLDNATPKGVIGVLQALRAVHKGFADLADVEHGRSFDVIPIFAGERIDYLFLKALLSFAKALVFTNGHI